eukprot:11181381-Lingulodinium_polyedra.AAC.1
MFANCACAYAISVMASPRRSQAVAMSIARGIAARTACVRCIAWSNAAFGVPQSTRVANAVHIWSSASMVAAFDGVSAGGNAVSGGSPSPRPSASQPL